jgi:hypothetical protein
MRSQSRAGELPSNEKVSLLPGTRLCCYNIYLLSPFVVKMLFSLKLAPDFNGFKVKDLIFPWTFSRREMMIEYMC